MVILIVIFGFMLLSTVLVIAAGMLSSRLSKQERWIENFEESETHPSSDVQSSPIR